jgi:chromosomal replication initiator protein
MFHPSEMHTFGTFELACGQNVMYPRPGWVIPLFRPELEPGNRSLFAQHIDEKGKILGFVPVDFSGNCQVDQDDVFLLRTSDSALAGFQLTNGRTVFCPHSELAEIIAGDMDGLSEMPYTFYEAATLLNRSDYMETAIKGLSSLPLNVKIMDGSRDIRSASQKHDTSMDLKKFWEDIREKLAANIGTANYATWIKPLKLRAFSSGVATFDAPTAFFAEWVSRNFSEFLLGTIKQSGVEVHRLKFTVVQDPAVDDNLEHSTRQSIAARPANDLRPSSEIDPRFTFNNFIVGKSNELAYASARRVSEGGAIDFNPLFIYGGVGLGKTHLMHAIAHELLAHRPESTVLYLSAEQFMYRFVQALRERQIMNFKEVFRSVDVLMVDDIQFIAGKDSTQAEFFHTFNSLIDQKKQIVICADRAPGEMGELEDRIRSRLQSGLVVNLHPTDYELRLGILQLKATKYLSQFPGLAIGIGVLELLADRITTNVRVLEGALTRLFAFASLVGREVTVELAMEVLPDLFRAMDQKVTIEEVQKRVARHFHISLSDLIGPKRHRDLTRARQVAIYLAQKSTLRSIPEIGRRFGGRDHTTVIYSIQKIEDLRSEDPALDKQIEALFQELVKS